MPCILLYNASPPCLINLLPLSPDQTLILRTSTLSEISKILNCKGCVHTWSVRRILELRTLLKWPLYGMINFIAAHPL
ncbi:hypothetical protein ACS0TY_011879 [Phlomoides rotata]